MQLVEFTSLTIQVFFTILALKRVTNLSLIIGVHFYLLILLVQVKEMLISSENLAFKRICTNS